MTEQSSKHRRAPIDMDPVEFRKLGHDLVDRISELLASIREQRVTPGAPPSAVRQALAFENPLPEQGTDAEAILSEATDLLIEHSLYNGHPRFFGYITSAPAPLGMLADLLAAAVNPNVGAWKLSPMATEIEAQTVRWIAQLIGYPDDCGGLLTSGGNVANFVGLLAARAAKAAWDVRAAGLMHGDANRLRLYASEETHTWVQKATDLAGLGTDSIRWVPTDPDLRMSIDALRDAIAEDVRRGDQPFMVIGTGGSVSTGAVDPLPAIATLCQKLDLWFHVDGAYGGFAAAVSEPDSDLRGLHHADSVAVDPHKWLYTPLEAGCTLVRDSAALRRAFSYHPPYYHFQEEALNYVDYGIQNSRGFRALKVWLQLRQAGREGYTQMIREDIRLAKELHDLAQDHPELEAMTHGLSITAFRYVPGDLRTGTGEESVERYLDELNRKLLSQMELGGKAFLSNAVIRGRFALRACIVNFRTSQEDVEALPGIVAQIGRQADQELRGRSES